MACGVRGAACVRRHGAAKKCGRNGKIKPESRGTGSPVAGWFSTQPGQMVLHSVVLGSRAGGEQKPTVATQSARRARKKMNHEIRIIHWATRGGERSAKTDVCVGGGGVRQQTSDGWARWFGDVGEIPGGNDFC